MNSPESKSDLTPFRDTLKKAPFSKGMETKPIMFLTHDPEVIVRVDKEYILRGRTREEKLEMYLACRDAFKQFNDHYKIPVVKHDVVIGENPGHPDQPIFYTVSELIHGHSLKYIHYQPEEKAAVREKLEHLYSALAEFIWDIYQKGGWIIDITHPEAQNSQFVWGRKKGETKDQIYLTDVDGNAILSAPRHPTMIEQFRPLVDMIEESENNLGGTVLSASRKKILSYAQSFPEGDPSFMIALELRRKLQDPTAGSDSEDKQVLEKAVDEFFQVPHKITFTKTDYQQCLENYFKGKHLEQTWNRQREAREEFGHPFDTFSYNCSTRELFLVKAMYHVAYSLYEQGLPNFQPLEPRYGSVIHTIAERIKPEIKNIVEKMPKEPYMKAKTESDRQSIASLGWEDDIMSHLNVVYFAINFSYSYRFLLDYMDYYLKLVSNQQGVTYPLPLQALEVVEEFNQHAARKKRTSRFNPINFSNFARNRVDAYIKQGLSTQLKGLEERYGKNNVSTLRDFLAKAETARLTREVFDAA